MKAVNGFLLNQIIESLAGEGAIEKALFTCLKLLREEIPADLLCLQFYKPDTGSHQVIAIATPEGGKRLDVSIPFAVEARDAADEVVENYEKTGDVIISHRPEKDPSYRTVLEYFKRGDSSLLITALEVGKRMVGSIALFADGHNRFNEKHAERFALIKAPFSTAIYNDHLYREVSRLSNMLKENNRFFQQELNRYSGERIVGEEFGLKEIMEKARQVADHNSPVLLLGETGTGKDLVARFIHQISSRRDEPFITVNCGAIPDSLLDSELFGHEKGAFTGAISQKSGRFERANKGSIFLDEIGEMPLSAQVRLLRVLQNKEIERVGGTKSIPVNVRVIAATNRNLEQMVKEEKFRNDLWFRLNVFPIKILPLRERKIDIPALLQYFLIRKSQELNLKSVPKVHKGSISILESYDWPGNVREFENIIERALIIRKGESLSFPDFGVVTPDKHEVFPNNFHEDSSMFSFDEMAKQYFQQVLQQTKGKIHGAGGAAEITNLNPSTLRNKLKKLGITNK
jgi:formate hydrogenlyase transcriptional activator